MKEFVLEARKLNELKKKQFIYTNSITQYHSE